MKILRSTCASKKPEPTAQEENSEVLKKAHSLKRKNTPDKTRKFFNSFAIS